MRDNYWLALCDFNIQGSQKYLMVQLDFNSAVLKCNWSQTVQSCSEKVQSSEEKKVEQSF